MPQEQDKEFARRLTERDGQGNRDKRVLYDIHRAYSGHLRHRLRRHLGSGFTDEDVDNIVQDSFGVLWKKFDVKRGVSVKAYLFGVADMKRRARVRTLCRRVIREEQDNERVRLADGESRQPDDRMIGVEQASDEVSLSKRKRALYDEACKTLEPKEKRAVDYFCLNPGYGWAEELEKKVGGSAHGWRKSKSEGFKKIRAYLAACGVRFSREEGRFDVA